MKSDQNSLDVFAAKIKELDLDYLALQEVDEALDRSSRESQIHYLAKKTKSPYWGFARTIIGSPESKWRKAKVHETLINHLDHSEQQSFPSYGIGYLAKASVDGISSLELGKSLIGAPLAVASEKGMRIAYVKDEPRVALATYLANGWLIVNVHLSFVPLVNYFQLAKVKRWAKKQSAKIIILGDFNLPGGIPTWGGKWRELHPGKSYPAWNPKIKFDHIITNQNVTAKVIEVDTEGLSDHRPLIIELDI
jgi:endonuclease/exonuclease/phosphatase family metal-dependent hydrolase